MIFLLTEDQQFLEMMIGCLRKKGKSARGIAHTEEFWVRLRQSSPDIIILDGNCPQFDALEILKDLKAEEYKGQTIVLGGLSSAPLDPEVSRLGAIQTAGRPVAINRVLGAIRIAGEHLATDPSGSSASRTETSSAREFHFS